MMREARGTLEVIDQSAALGLAVLEFLLGSDDIYSDTLIVKDEKELITDKGRGEEKVLKYVASILGKGDSFFCFRMLSRIHSVPWNSQFCHKSKRYHQEVASQFCYIPSTPSSTSPGNK